jgi:ATP adenylyltransferase
MQVLWAPWRMAYVGGPREAGCIFCTKPAAVDRRAGLVLAVTEHSAVMLNRFPYANAHIMVAPRRHAGDLALLPADEYGELSETLRRSMAVLQRVFGPDGMNVGMNAGAAAGAGIADHLHWHVVPRWVGDTNYMPLIAEVRVIPEHLDALYDRLRPEFAPFEKG